MLSYYNWAAIGFIILVLLILNWARKQDHVKLYSRVLMGVYVMVLLWGTILSRKKANAAIVSFDVSSWKQLIYFNVSQVDGSHTVGIGPIQDETVLNILLLIPLGILLPYAFTHIKNWWKVLLICFLISSAIEVSQYVLRRGWFDVDDLLLNIIGGILGYFLYNLRERKIGS